MDAMLFLTKFLSPVPLGTGGIKKTKIVSVLLASLFQAAYFQNYLSGLFLGIILISGRSGFLPSFMFYSSLTSIVKDHKSSSSQAIPFLQWIYICHTLNLGADTKWKRFASSISVKQPALYETYQRHRWIFMLRTFVSPFKMLTDLLTSLKLMCRLIMFWIMWLNWSGFSRAVTRMSMFPSV